MNSYGTVDTSLTPVPFNVAFITDAQNAFQSHLSKYKTKKHPSFAQKP